MNYLGKALVLVNLLLSVLFLAWAGAIYTQKVDWGWKDPRKHLESERVASEIDKRRALLKELLPVMVQADRQLDGDKTKKRMGQITQVIGFKNILVENHDWYNKKLGQLQSAPDKIEILQLKFDKGVVVTDRNGQPVLEKKVTFTDGDKNKTDVDKSYDSYGADLRKIGENIDRVMVAIQKWTEQQKDVTARLNGTQDDMGKVLRPGLYGLLQRETDAQDSIKKEITYLRPRWVRELVDAQLLLERQEALRSRLEELKAVKAARR